MLALIVVRQKILRKPYSVLALRRMRCRCSCLPQSELPEAAQLPAIILGIAMHGLCGCFIFVAFMVVDENVPPMSGQARKACLIS